MIEVKHIKKVFGEHTVLSDVSISVANGSVYGLIGKNGAGKTTLLNIIAGLSEPTSGSINISTNKSTKVGFLPDVPAYFDYLTAAEYIDFLMKEKNTDTIGIRNQLLTMVKLDGDTKIISMSRGMKQRLGIAAVLVGDPEVILLDEPTSALDPAGRHELIDILKKLKTNDKSIILSTHILNDMENLCDRVGFLHGGVIKHEMIPDQTKKNFLEIGVEFGHPVSVEDINLPDCSIELIDEYQIEIRVKNCTVESVVLQKEILTALASMTAPITCIHTLKPSLDLIFQEICL